MLTCIALTVLVTWPPVPPLSERVYEKYSYTFCERGYLSDTEYPSQQHTACEIAANTYLEVLQLAGVLPGSKEIVTYRVTCYNTI